MALLITLLLLSAAAFLAYAYRDRIENVWPGYKAYAFHALLSLFSIAGYVTHAVNLIDWSQWLGPKSIALGGLVIGGIGFLISMVTKRFDKNHDGVLDEHDFEEEPAEEPAVTFETPAETH